MDDLGRSVGVAATDDAAEENPDNSWLMGLAAVGPARDMALENMLEIAAVGPDEGVAAADPMAEPPVTLCWCGRRRPTGAPAMGVLAALGPREATPPPAPIMSSSIRLKMGSKEATESGEARPLTLPGAMEAAAAAAYCCCCCCVQLPDLMRISCFFLQRMQTQMTLEDLRATLPPHLAQHRTEQ